MFSRPSILSQISHAVVKFPADLIVEVLKVIILRSPKYTLAKIKWKVLILL